MLTGILLGAFRMCTPLLFAALGGMFCERSGVINIALEGFLLIGAFVGAACTIATGNPWIGFGAAFLVGVGAGLLYGFFVIHLRANQIIAGTAMNFLAMGFLPFALHILYGSTGASPSIPLEQRFALFPLYAAWIMVALAWLVMHRLPLGLWFSFAGENPAALEAAGFSVKRIRYLAVTLGCALTAAGGASLSLYLSSGYSRNMAAGRGFIALAALLIGKWRPIPVAIACFFFALTESLQIALLSNMSLPIPAEFVQILPYLATLLVLAGFLGHARAPKALGN